ncbi:MAG: hypothetical protein OES25_13000, partial [Acidobacteriota bacterium]|nr:hypothetical protein [Acidobacteriota bacterium]
RAAVRCRFTLGILRVMQSHVRWRTIGDRTYHATHNILRATLSPSDAADDGMKKRTVPEAENDPFA